MQTECYKEHPPTTDYHACLEREAIFLYKNVFHRAPDRAVLDKYIQWHEQSHKNMPTLDPIIERSLDVEALLATRHPSLWPLRLKVQALVHLSDYEPQPALGIHDAGKKKVSWTASKLITYGSRYAFKAAKGIYLLHKHSLI